MANRFIAANVEDIAVTGIVSAYAQKGVGSIIPKRRLLDGLPDEPPDETLTIMRNQLSWAIDVREAQRHRLQTICAAVSLVVLLACRLVDAVHVDRLDRVIFGHGKCVRVPVHVPRACVNDLGFRIVMQDIRSEADQAPCEGAADETETSRNHDAAAPVMLKIFRGMRQWSRESCHE